MAKRKIEWENGDVFVVPLIDSTYAIGQILDLQMKTVVRITLFNEKIKGIEEIKIDECCKDENLICIASCTREQLDYGVWKIIVNKNIKIPLDKFPNELFRNNGWIGAKIYDAVILEDFLNAFYGFLPWDDWADAGYLDKLLIDESKKPSNLILIKNNS